MNIIQKIVKYATNNNYRFFINDVRGFYNKLPDEKYLKLKWKSLKGYELDLKNPKTFNEKLQWLKLHDRNPFYTTLVDKVLVKDYVASIIGNEHIIPTLGVWKSVLDIDFNTLPERFVLKCNHNSGTGMFICKDKQKMDKKSVCKELNEGLAEDYYLTQREWPYKNIERKIIAEHFITNSDGELNDYKFFCFDGKVKFFKIDFDRFTFHRANYYDINGNLLPYGEIEFPRDPQKVLQIPSSLQEMIQYAELLSFGYSFMRVDFYDVDGKVYFGEITLYPTAGFGNYDNDGDAIIGKELHLSL